MAVSTCHRCDGQAFESVVHLLESSQVVFVQCSACGCIVGVTEFLNLGAALVQLRANVADNAAALAELKRRVMRIEQAVCGNSSGPAGGGGGSGGAWR